MRIWARRGAEDPAPAGEATHFADAARKVAGMKAAAGVWPGGAAEITSDTPAGTLTWLLGPNGWAAQGPPPDDCPTCGGRGSVRLSDGGAVTDAELMTREALERMGAGPGLWPCPQCGGGGRHRRRPARPEPLRLASPLAVAWSRAALRSGGEARLLHWVDPRHVDPELEAWALMVAEGVDLAPAWAGVGVLRGYAWARARSEAEARDHASA